MGNCSICAIRSKAVEVLNPEEIDILQYNCAEVSMHAGESIIKEGSLSSHIAYLKSGLAKIHKKGVKGTDQILKILQPGCYIGMQTVLSDKIHQYSTSTIEESVVCFIDITSFKELISRNAQFANELILYLCRDELSYFSRFVNIHQKQVAGRLADTVLFFADEVRKSSNPIIPLSRNDLAALTCTTRESVTRAIKELSDIGTIRVKGRSFEILNYELLKKISEKG
ncbi:MAG: Crp/Fnr family transcriptional regulator [Bacteroidales bacterium]|jgi:CRP/FNR family transcriptional regulator|nr:Crp/Fnr family transcriptional regulator [Bacteroidales bacterium]